AFGTGSHPSTHLVLNFLEKQIQGNERVLDYGCGSGILAIAAAKLGAGEVDAGDIDPQALEVARGNAGANGVAPRAVRPAELPGGHYDLVLANILSGPLIELAPELRKRTRPGGRILLSGLFESQAAEVHAAYATAFEIEIAEREGDWVLIAGT